MSEDRFDMFSRDAADGMTRRKAVRRIGAGMGAALAAALLPATAEAACPSGSQKCGGAGCCPDGAVCCKIQGAHYCCPTAGLINLGGCPGTQAAAINLGCTRVL